MVPDKASNCFINATALQNGLPSEDFEIRQLDLNESVGRKTRSEEVDSLVFTEIVTNFCLDSPCDLAGKIRNVETVQFYEESDGEI